MGNNIKKYKKILKEKDLRLKKLNEAIEAENDLRKKQELEMEAKALYVEIESFVRNVYAKAVFDLYSPKKPKLVRRLTKEVFTWDEAFGDNFDKIPLSLKESLVGLVEGSGKYKLK